MRTLITALAFLCSCMNALMFADWILRGETLLACGAGVMGVLCLVVAVLVHRLRF